MRLFLLLPFLYFIISCSTTKSEQPVQIQTNAYSALMKFDSGFKIWNQSDYMPSVRKLLKTHPGITAADFNGDGVIDYAITGHNKVHDFLLAVVSKGQTYRVYQIDKATIISPEETWMETSAGKKEYGFWNYLTPFKKRKVNSSYETSAVKLKNDSFQVQYFEKGSLLYYFNGNRFIKYITSD